MFSRSEPLEIFHRKIQPASQRERERERHIAENFISTQEILQRISNLGTEAVFAKIDFAKAFDSVNWLFL